MNDTVRSLLWWYWHAWKDPQVAAARLRALEPDPALLTFSPNELYGFVRKVGVRFRWWNDYTSMTQSRVFRRQRAVARREPFASLLRSAGPRFLLRLDDFPSPFVESARMLEAHRILRDHGIPYTIAVTPFLQRGSNAGLTPDELGILRTIAAEGAVLSVHGFTHARRTPPLSSELAGMPSAELKSKMADAARFWQELERPPSVFVAPFNAYDRATFGDILERYPIVCGGPESVLSVGYRAPSFIGDAMYLPSYRGVYDLQDHPVRALERCDVGDHGLMVPVTVHWAEDVAGAFKNLRELAPFLAGKTMSWTELLDVRRQILTLTAGAA